MVRKSNNGFFGRKGNRVKFVAAFCLAVGLLLPACAKPAENEAPPQKESWTASFGGQVADGGQSADGKQSANGGQAADGRQEVDGEQSADGGAKMTPKPTNTPNKGEQVSTKTIEEKMEEILAGMAYPTVVPPREFTPKEGQTELVLWMSLEGRWRVDDHIVAELNHILQERGYPFYLTVKMEPEPESVRDALSPWQEIFDAGEEMDLVFFFDSDDNLSGKSYGKTSMERMLAGGYLLPFSKYPDTPAKKRLRSAYGEEYWRMCSFGGENYGISNWMLNYPVGKEYLLLNLDAAGEAGIEIPETMDLLHLDGLLEKASAAGIPGIGVYTSEILRYCGILRRSDSLFVKCLPDGGYSFVNPFADEELQRTMEAVNRYWENGRVDKGLEEKLPLLLLETSCGALSYLEGDRFVRWTNDGNEQSARVKVYREENYVVQEGSLRESVGSRPSRGIRRKPWSCFV